MQSRIPSGQGSTQRIISNSSVTSELTIGTTISIDSPKNSNPSLPLDDETYDAILKVILLEYKKEPRFHVSPIPSRPSSPAPTTRPSYDSRSKRHSWFGSAHTETESLPKDAVPKLKDLMVKIAMGKSSKVKDPLTKRCFLHLYNIMLKPGFQVTKAEELVVLFIGGATKEIKLYQEANTSNIDVFDEVDKFISVLLGVLKECKNSEASIKRLQEYRNSSKPLNNQSRQSSSTQLQIPTSKQITPSYRISEISRARLVGELFGVDELKLQRDVIRLKDSSNENVLLADLESYKQRLHKNESVFNPDDFDVYDDYFAWKKKEGVELEELIKKLQNPISPKTGIDPQTLQFIPQDPRSAISDFAVRILQYDTSDSTVLMSNTFKDLLRLCCRYWRINEESQAVLLYRAAHYTLLKNPENLLNIEKTEALFGLLYSLLQHADHPKHWAKVNKKLWITNLSNSYIQVMSSLRDTLTLIYNSKAPKLTPILSILFEYIEEDPLYDVITKSDLPERWLKRLRNTILETTEKKYIDILETIPRDNTLDLIHVKETSETINKIIQQLHKKFPKPLLGEIMITKEAGNLFIKLYSEDLKNMLGHIEYYSTKSQATVDTADAMETFTELNILRNTFESVKKSPKSKFSFDIEGFFFKYVNKLCDESIKRIFPVFQKSLDNDKFEPIDLDQGIGYSHSVLDIFKMINEVFNMFKNLNWQNQRQMAYIYTKLMKSVSDSIVYYCTRIKLKIMDDLKDDVVSNTPDRKSNLWLFDEMKAAISNNSKLPVPEPYSFKFSTCVAINNLSQMLKQLKTLESQINPEEIKVLASGTERSKTQPSNNVFTIVVVKAENVKPAAGDGLSDAYVQLIDSSQKRQIGRTKTIPQTLNPVYEEEFEFESVGSKPQSITANIWHHGSKRTSHELLGRTVLQLDPKKFRNDGIAEEIVRDFDVQGKLYFQVSSESEKGDIIFSIGRAYRSISRTLERAYTFIVEKFTVFITYSFSRQTLKSICSSSGFKRPTEEETSDAVVPLFDYLNANLQILAATLDNSILLKVMLQSWKVILNSADNLLLPALACVKMSNVSSSSHTNWKNSLTTAVASMTNSSSIPGYGRSLTPIEMSCVFVWLNALCEFFHNEGSGPPLEDLKNDYFERILLVEKYYQNTPNALKGKIDTLAPLVFKTLKTKNFLGEESVENGNDKDLIVRKNTIARKNTVLAYGSSKRRKEAEQAAKETDQLIGDIQIYTEDTILRILLTKGEKEFVSRRLFEREKLAKSLATERLARLAVRGKR